MRKRFNVKHIRSICESGDYGIFAPPMKAQVAVDELCRYFLGDEWYDSSGATHPEQVNTAIVCAIEERYKGCKVRRYRMSIFDLIKQLLCKHEEQECITNFHGDYINTISTKHTYRSAWRCRKCNKLIYHEELEPSCKVVNWQAQ